MRTTSARLSSRRTTVGRKERRSGCSGTTAYSRTCVRQRVSGMRSHPRNCFLQLLDRYKREGRNVSDKVGPSFAPAKFRNEPEAKQSRVGNKNFTSQCCDCLRVQIKVVTEGSPSHPRTRIVRTGKKDEYSPSAWWTVEGGEVPERGDMCAMPQGGRRTETGQGYWSEQT